MNFTLNPPRPGQPLLILFSFDAADGLLAEPP
jgi:hypothetical protein